MKVKKNITEFSGALDDLASEVKSILPELEKKYMYILRYDIYTSITEEKNIEFTSNLGNIVRQYQLIFAKKTDNSNILFLNF